MITIQQLAQFLEDKQKHKALFIFYADKYKLHINFTIPHTISIYTIIENLTNYNPTDRIARLKYYVQQNTQVLGYMYSTLAYNKDNNVVIQQWLDKTNSIDKILHAIDEMLIHADILTNTHY
ncbi:MAG: hypothetical protein ABW007_13465 [Chitinophagaceae bacterium]